jgi:rubrerythrin
MHTLSHLEEALRQKEQALIQYVRYMREAQDSQNTDMAALFADLAKAEEKHIAVIRDQVAMRSKSEMLNKYQQINEYNSQHATYDEEVEPED